MDEKIFQTTAKCLTRVNTPDKSFVDEKDGSIIGYEHYNMYSICSLQFLEPVHSINSILKP